MNLSASLRSSPQRKVIRTATGHADPVQDVGSHAHRIVGYKRGNRLVGWRCVQGGTCTGKQEAKLDGS